MTKKEAVLLLEQTEPQDQLVSNHESIIPGSPADVKPEMNELAALRIKKGIPVREMVEVVQRFYPKYDKIIQSKCEHGSEYGIQIRDDALRALLLRFAPETVKRRNHDKKRNSNRIQARLTEPVAQQLRKALAEDDYTVQGWMEEQVYNYLEGRRKKNVQPS